ncbi:MAG: hypothetical protein ACI4U9_01645 [Clostridia bacterium]
MCDCNTIYITGITTTSTGVVLIPNRQITQTNLANADKYNLIIACGLKSTNSLPVFIQTSAGNIPVLCKFGNTVYSNQLRTRYRYCIGYGNRNTNYTLGQFTVFNNLCCAFGSSSVRTVSAVSVKKESE